MPASISDPAPALAPFFEARGWSPFPFQRETWSAYLSGHSGLLHAPTGFGKTLAVFLGPVAETLALSQTSKPPSTILWLTPLRALAKDTLRSLREPLEILGLDWEVAARTGDTSSHQRAKLRKRLPFCLVTTPESLSLMLTYEDFRTRLDGLRCVVIDEWHELLGSKRGVQTELCLARLRRWFPTLRTWGLSATLGNLTQAAQVLYPPLTETLHPPSETPPPPVLFSSISGDLRKEIRVETILPKSIERFPWSGHLGTTLVRQVAQRIARADTTLLFTNTRSQTEIWSQALSGVRPKWEGQLAVHHGSLDLSERQEVEGRLREGSVRCVVCTSSLDLGVDFSPVDQVIQVGSPKGVARLLQRAGRSGHQPGKLSKILCVPTNALELVEFAAARDAIQSRQIEARTPLRKPLDVLVQHLVTLTIGQADRPADLRREVESTHAFHDLTDQEWEWALGFITTGGKALQAYPNYRKAELLDGLLTVQNKRHIQLHRMSIGTITSSDLSVTVRYSRGPTLGTVEEGFISKMKAGDQFIFAGRRLELLSFRDQTAKVRNATRASKGRVAIWGGSRMALSNELAPSVARRLHQPVEDAATARVAPILAIQRKWSQLPSRTELLVEHTRTDEEGEHLFVFPMAGRLVHEGLGALAAYRFTRDSGATIQVSMNDYGFALHSGQSLPFDEEALRAALHPENLLDDLVACLNTVELARRKFREVARVAGLVIQNFPGRRRTTRDLQASSSLLYDVFRNYDPDNLLLAQAEREILEQQLEWTRLKSTMEDLAQRPFRLVETERLSPFAFPLWADRIQAVTSGRDYATRLETMLKELEDAAG